MENILPYKTQEVVFSSAEKSVSRKISALVKKGEIRKIAPRIYTATFNSTAEEIIKRNIFIIIGSLFPGSVLSHRSAFEFWPTSENQLFVSYKYTRNVELPGFTIRLLKGEKALQSDTQFAGGLMASNRERAFLENLQFSKRPGPTSKTLSIPEVESKLEQIIRVNGEDELNVLRDNAKIIAEKLGMQKEWERLNMLVSALLTTHDSSLLTSPLAISRSQGLPYDPHRIEIFQELFRSLKTKEFKNRTIGNEFTAHFKSFAFYESYFSNYIEGTRFAVEEAQKIIETNKPMPARDYDSHDVLGTYQIVSSVNEMVQIPDNPDELFTLLMRRHKVLLGARIEKKPGEFKGINNFAGQTSFVDYKLVRGTFAKAFEYYTSLVHPFARAAYMMFIVSEVHPFLDGNGRIARVMMNAEFVHQERVKIIIPTVMREDYILALRRLSRQSDPEPYVRMLSKAHAFSEAISSWNLEEMLGKLKKSNAFFEPSEGKLRVIEG